MQTNATMRRRSSGGSAAGGADARVAVAAIGGA
jgi:hypothetical protein